MIQTFNHDLLRSFDLTAYRLAKNCEIGYNQLLAYVNGKVVPSLQTARLISTTLNLPLENLIFPAEKKEL